MIRQLIEDNTEAKAIADAYGVSASMIAEAEAQLPQAIATNTGIVIGAKRAARVAHLHGPFEFVFVAYFAGFIEGENGWSVFRWSEVQWDELPLVAEQLDLVEKQILPHAVGSATATKRFFASEHNPS